MLRFAVEDSLNKPSISHKVVEILSNHREYSVLTRRLTSLRIVNQKWFATTEIQQAYRMCKQISHTSRRCHTGRKNTHLTRSKHAYIS